MGKLSEEERLEKILKLDKFGRAYKYGSSICIDGTGFRYNVLYDRWLKLIEPYVFTYPVPDDGFYDKIRTETNRYSIHKPSSIEDVLETVSDDIRDTILFNLNLFR